VSGGWEGSDRRAELPPNWRQLCGLVKRRAGRTADGLGHRCEWREPDGSRCWAVGRDVDHVGDKHDHRLAVLRLLCENHHDKRSSEQGNAARWAHGSNKRKPEAQPGLLTEPRKD